MSNNSSNKNNKRYLSDDLYKYISTFIPKQWCKCPGRQYTFTHTRDEEKFIEWGIIANGAIVAFEYKYIINGGVVVQCTNCLQFHCYHCYEISDGHRCGPY